MKEELNRFIKDWTLPICITIGGIAYLLAAHVKALEPAARTCGNICNQSLPILMFVVLYVTFCKVNFKQLVPVKWHLWVSVFQISTILALVAIAHRREATGSELALIEAAITCIISPGATAAAVMTQKLGGNIEEMTTYTVLSNFITALLIPICFPLIEPSVEINFYDSFTTISYRVAMVLLLPMPFAYITKHHLHKLHQSILRVKDLSYYLWGITLMILTGTTLKNISQSNASSELILLIAMTGLVLCIMQFAIGRAIGRKMGATIEAGQALGQKNTTFGIWIASTYLNPLSSVGPGCYILWQNIFNSVEIWHYQRQIGKREKGKS